LSQDIPGKNIEKNGKRTEKMEHRFTKPSSSDKGDAFGSKDSFARKRKEEGSYPSDVSCKPAIQPSEGIGSLISPKDGCNRFRATLSHSS
jgi:hypothetical protein